MIHAQNRLCPRKCVAKNSFGPWDSNISHNPGEKTWPSLTEGNNLSSSWQRSENERKWWDRLISEPCQGVEKAVVQEGDAHFSFDFSQMLCCFGLCVPEIRIASMDDWIVIWRRLAIKGAPAVHDTLIYYLNLTSFEFFMSNILWLCQTQGLINIFAYITDMARYYKKKGRLCGSLPQNYWIYLKIPTRWKFLNLSFNGFMSVIKLNVFNSTNSFRHLLMSSNIHMSQGSSTVLFSLFWEFLEDSWNFNIFCERQVFKKLSFLILFLCKGLISVHKNRNKKLLRLPLTSFNIWY